MADEATVVCSLQINKSNLQYVNRPTAYKATLTGSKGPTPGAVSVPTSGVDVSFSELTTPGLCALTNVDDTNYVEVGVHDGTLFHPVLELLPGETQVVRLSRNLGEEADVSGTGTTGTVNSLHLKANGATVVVKVEAFEK